MDRQKLEALVADTWDELGYSIRATGWKVWVRTLPWPRKIGLIHLPVKQASFHGELPHLRTVRAVVLSAGPKGHAEELQAGDLITFKRLEFGYMFKLEPRKELGDAYGHDEEFVGFIDSNHIVGVVEEDIDAAPQQAASSF